MRYFLDSHFRQTADIDLGVAPYNAGEGWHPIGIRDLQSGDDLPFTGGYDGGGFAISNLRIDRQGNQVNGLFGSVSDAELKGISLPNLMILGNQASAGLAVFAVDSEIENCSVNGSLAVDGFQACAGLIYSLSDSSLKGCRAAVDVDFGAGLVATANECSIVDCHVSGTVRGPAGLVGSTFRTLIDRCSSSAEVTGTYRTGGLVGFNFYLSMIVQSYATGKVTGTDSVGGLVGENQYNSAIAQCYSTGEVKGQMRVGGLVGQHHHMWMDQPIPTLVINSFARGKVTGTGQLVGGLIGDAEQDFVNCYSTGEVIGPDDYAGGMTGFAGPNHVGSAGIRSYWDVESSGRHSSKGGLPRLSSELTWPHSSDTFQNWDFHADWSLDVDHSVNDGYPYLRELPLAVAVGEENLAPTASLSVSSHPNPFRESVTVELKSIASGKVSVKAFNLRGQLVKTLLDAELPAGAHTTEWNGLDANNSPVSSGVYFYRMQAGDYSKSQKMIMMK